MRVDAATLGALFVLGVLQSVGPCVLQRAVSLSTITATAARPIATMLVFVAGVVCAYQVYLLATPFVSMLTDHIGVLYAVMAVAMLVGAFWTIRRSGHEHHHVSGDTRLFRGGVFLLGMSTVLQIAPCCTLIALAIVTNASVVGIPGAGLMLAAYGLGHVVPLLFVGLGSLAMRTWVARAGASRWLTYVNGGILGYLAIYFAVQV